MKNLDSNRIHVYNYIAKYFNLDEVNLREFSVFPGGIIVEDRIGGFMLFYWDIEKQKVVFENNDKS
ncbi:MAG: hypothetical protein GX765_05625 [Candidatus Moranbacteria bacterium]|nr:hypothetical protein [Candidatus Moranbacteria bacterium]